ncbi:ABC transporter ATP-binding protein [Pseudoalteromonas rubra]|uniref:ABC transporter ATP-binding protein n=1 Tax=Pseudoalteromonas rubra TaxID=43658 RepID=A0A5S3WU78_9GAMM|nr:MULTISPECIES: ABC transporter ATP-binding protein [Pseudoalteromonas]AZZ97452.1 ABC transporter ATP-binding protein [Pseudoalteromonas sp. R3]TMP28286.1 ABC transporter ATP-binding protein [Pseudoalteromonas rubra]TMP28328.1 ABC transporter ATP-binding protein [Pseudoalteromonas rubra]TMP32905.1 ABC transporter ATP-binding protein [Pseudoalteromonas rubra]
MSKSIITLNGIKKVYATEEMETHALRGVNLEIKEGEFVSICGPSGCGKSTLLSILGLLDIPSEGTYMLDGMDVSSLSIKEAAAIRNQKIGFIFQSFNLIDELSVYDNVALPLDYANTQYSDEEIRTRVEKCLATVDMLNRAGHKPNQLSGGQQQRVAIARALVCEPALLLVDEATGNLDSKNGDAVMAMLKSLNDNGTTICLVTHDPRYADHANKQFRLSEGLIEQHIEQVAEAV